MIIKKAKIDWSYNGDALTLNPDFVRNPQSSGWVIKGQIQEDYFEWINDFEAEHEEYGKIWGNFEKEVYADTEEGFEHFYENHKPDSWDYAEIAESWVTLWTKQIEKIVKFKNE